MFTILPESTFAQWVVGRLFVVASASCTKKGVKMLCGVVDRWWAMAVLRTAASTLAGDGVPCYGWLDARSLVMMGSIRWGGSRPSRVPHGGGATEELDDIKFGG